MKVLLASPNFHQHRGNTVTVKRISNSLEKLGVETEIISSTDENITYLPKVDIVHGFHAYSFYRFIQQLDEKPEAYIITITGTDLNYYLFNQATRADVIECLEGATAIHVFHEKGKEVIRNIIPTISDKLFVIQQGASEFPEIQNPIQKENNSFVFLLPAGIRKIKNVPFAIEKLSKLHQKYSHIKLNIVGPVIEEQEAVTVKQLVKKNSHWVTYIGQVEHEQMGTLYNEADCVLNTSDSEGQPAAILEAMGFGLPVLVSDNEGNRSIVNHQENGLIFSNENQFLDYAEQIVNNIKLRQTIGEKAMRYVETNHSSSREARSLLNIYKKLCQY